MLNTQFKNLKLVWPKQLERKMNTSKTRWE
nr:MAG TPA: hypothetical protein [Caudoviricetes sp.]